MKKLLIRLAGFIIVAAAAAGLWYYSYYRSPEQALKRAIEHYAGAALGTQVRVDRVQLSLDDGSGVITGLTVGNPEGFRSASAVAVESIKMTVDVASLAKGVVVLRAVSFVRPRITIESGQTGSNFERLVGNIQSYVEKAGPPDSHEPKFVVEKLVMHGGTVRSVPVPDAGQSVEVNMPQVSASNIGLANGGIAASRLPVTMLEIIAYHARRALPSKPTPPPRPRIAP